MNDQATPTIGLVLDCADPERLAESWAPPAMPPPVPTLSQPQQSIGGE